jgi:hypothetical protein
VEQNNLPHGEEKEEKRGLLALNCLSLLPPFYLARCPNPGDAAMHIQDWSSPLN